MAVTDRLTSGRCVDDEASDTLAVAQRGRHCTLAVEQHSLRSFKRHSR